MRLPTLRPMLLCVALLVACAQATATEARQTGPDGSGSCPDSASNSAEHPDEAEASDDSATTAVRRTQKTKPAPSASPRATSGGGGRNTPPRFHSFLPGMFR